MPAIGSRPSTKGSSWVTSLRLPPVSETASGTPRESLSRWCLEPVRARSTGEGPVQPPSQSAYVAAIDRGRCPVDPAGLVEPAQQLSVKSVEDPGPLPVLQASVCGRRRAAEFLWQVSPGDAGDQDEDDRAEDC
ncbi:MAG: hypothetical protein BroJett022_06140 [Actinomycetes bacterium]|nr:MAG: hypothetical protein BroJett022_06140 [Actinomycetes bacterium]